METIANTNFKLRFEDFCKLPLKPIHQRIMDVASAKDLSSREVCREAGLSDFFLYSFCTGNHTKKKLEAVEAICTYLGQEKRWIFTGLRATEKISEKLIKPKEVEQSAPTGPGFSDSEIAEIVSDSGLSKLQLAGSKTMLVVPTDMVAPVVEVMKSIVESRTNELAKLSETLSALS